MILSVSLIFARLTPTRCRPCIIAPRPGPRDGPAWCIIGPGMKESRPPTPSAFYVMAKPTGARCNLACDYCFFLKKDRLYPGSGFRMNEATMEAYIRQTVEGQTEPEVTLAWQGGEPT